jgi:deazaflavin-dependent oxidoreductase (nitroreductase family)
VLWRLSRRTKGWVLPLAGRRWNPIFGLVSHRGRRSGRQYVTPIAARRVAGGFIISLAFGAHVDWHRNLEAADGGSIRWRGRDYEVTGPEIIGIQEGLAAFHPVQRLFLWIARIDGYIRVRDATVPTR